MTSLFRPFIAALLSCVIVFGQAPAWLHVAVCDSESHAVAAEIAPAQGHCGCPHDHHAGKRQGTRQASVDATQVGGDASHHHHDADDCVICQSLASPGGVVRETGGSIAFELAVQPVFVSTDRRFDSATASLSQPRGPPTV